GLPVGADAEHDGTGALELSPGVANVAGLAGTSRRVVLGVEVEDDRLATPSGGAGALAPVGGGRAVRCGVSVPKHGGSAARVPRLDFRRVSYRSTHDVPRLMALAVAGA